MAREWWETFFTAETIDFLFRFPEEVSRKEVAQCLRRAKVKQGAIILDLACGVGCHSIEFAKRGYQVMGLDYSKEYLQEAKQRISNLHLEQQIELVRGDMRDLSRHFKSETFDLVVSLFNSFGYFKRRRDDRRVLREMVKVLKPGGALVINTLNLGGVKKRLVEIPRLLKRKEYSDGREPVPNLFVIDQIRFDRGRKRTHAEWTVIDARQPKTKITRLEVEQNVYSHRDFERMLKPLGLHIETMWGRLSGGKFDPSSWHQTFVARKESCFVWRKNGKTFPD